MSKNEEIKNNIDPFKNVNDLFKDIGVSALSGAKIHEKVEAIACHILIRNGCFATKSSSEHIKAMSPSEIIEEYGKLRKNPDTTIVEVADNSIRSILSQLAKDDGSQYLWQDNQKKYYFKYDNNSVESDSPKDNLDDKESKENEIYPLLSDWLNGLDRYKVVKVVANMRSRSGVQKNTNYSRRWKYPDIIAVDFKPNLLAQDKHFLTTIEVKTTAKNWQQDIFEAVSHSLFAHYSYFAFIAGDNEKIDPEIKKYAHFFNIGIIKITIPQEDRDKIDKKSVNFQDLWKNGKLEIDEYVQAPYHEPDFEMHYEYLGTLDVKTIQDLRNLDSRS